MLRIAVAMSGGVDSAVAAHLLVREGHDVIGFFMRTGIKAGGAGAGRSCCGASDARDAARVAGQLSIPFYSLNIADGFARLREYFAREYLAGRTPSPCVHCNGWLKFGELLSFARECGADAVATGHYARVDAGGVNGRRRLVRAADRQKDQSYFLFSLDQQQLAAVRFPLGELTKDEVRDMAGEAGLCVQAKPESQEICFAPTGKYADVVEHVTGVRAAPGPILDRTGKRLGTHKGTIHYTIGQRRGIGIAFGEPRYVTAIDPDRNTLVVGADADLFSRRAVVREVSWIGEVFEPGATFRARAQIRYRHAPADAKIVVGEDAGATATFDDPQRAIVPGQALVISRGDEILGGGWIEGASASGRGRRR